MKSDLLLPTLKARLVFWFTAICLIPLALMTTAIYLQRLGVAKALIFDKLSAVSSLRRQQIDTSLDNLAKDASTLAGAHSVLQAATALAENPEARTSGAGADALILFRGYLNNHDTVADVSIVSRAGTVLLSTAAGKRGGRVADPETVASALRDRVPTYGEAYLPVGEGAPSLDVAAPVGNPGDRAIPAAVVVRYNLRKLLYDVVDNRIGMGRTGETVLVNRDVVSLVELHDKPGSALKARLTGRPAEMAAQGQTGIAETVDYRGAEVLAAYAYIPRTGWGLVCKQDSGEVFAPLVSLLWVTYGLASLISLLACLFAVRLARSVSRPITDLSRAAAEIGAGDYSRRIAPEGTSEQRELAASFNAMTDALRMKIDAQQGLARISESLVTARGLDDFFGTLLPVLMRVTGARMAVAFMEEKEGDRFVAVGAVGADPSLMRAFSRKNLEGELGVVLCAGSVSRFSAADGGSLRFVTSFGEIAPSEIVTVPVAVDDELRAFVSLASEGPFSATALEILEHARLPLGAGFSRVLAGEDVRRLAGELSAKNAELTEQSEELVQQSTELAHQSGELHRRNEVLDRQKQLLEEATRLKSEFLSNMSHELRTPLNSVLALSRVLALQGAERLTEEERGYLSIIERNGRHLLSLINDILDLAKIESGRQDLHRETLSVEAIAAEVVEALLPIARDKGISLALATRGPLPFATTDAKRLRQILQNLVGNAVKFTSEGSVTVGLAAEAGMIRVDVEDTGIGIAPQCLETIFHEFRQADGSTSRSFEGTGLGLAIVKKTADLLGGEVSVESRPGRGSLFTFRLPIDCGSKPGASDRPTEAARPEALQRSRRGRSVLVVDDDPEAVSLIAGHLSRSGYETVTALNGADALRLARAVKPFAITLDVVMPEMDGWEVMRELKEHPDTADIPVIVVSLSEDRETGIALGAIGVVTKPVDRRQLIEELEKLAGAGCRLVLVVDDSELDRFFIASLFKENGMDVLLAENGPQALELALADHPDLITLDLVMPGMEGADVLDRLRACESTAAIPVVVITSKDLTREELARLSSGVSAILSKGGLDRELMLKELVKSLERLGWSVPGGGVRKCPRILIVEDSEAATIQLRFALESAGFSVDAVSGGRHALDYLRTHVPDGIVLDLMMPEVDGFAVLRAVRGSSLTERIPVMVMTAKTLSPGEHDRLRELDVRHLVQKGDVDQQELLGRVQEMLGAVRVFREVEPSGAEPAAPVAGARPGDGSLLVVEDNPDNMAALRAVLGKGYRIAEAVDGEAGLAAARAGSPSLILLDMQLPRMDGMTVLKALKRDAATAGIPVVALTASAMAGDREKLLAAGCADYLSKPYRPEDLAALVHRFIGETTSA